jgi:hypothetical protein
MSPKLNHTILLDHALKIWMLCIDTQSNLGIHTPDLPVTNTKPAPNSIDLRYYSKKDEDDLALIIPCIVQVSENGKIKPQDTFYIVLQDENFVLVKPDPLVLGKGAVVFQMKYLNLQVYNLFMLADCNP